MNMDVRWIQRLDNYKSALKQLVSAADVYRSRPLTDLEKQGVIQAFEFTHELAWNVIKDYFEYQGQSSINGSRDATREAFQKNLISEGEVWMEMIRSRNLTSHTYNKNIANDIVEKTIKMYLPVFIQFEFKMDSLKA